MYQMIEIRVCADIYSARPLTKNDTANKLGIYIPYFPPRSIRFLSHCSIPCKTLKKFRNLSVQTGLRGSSDLHVGRKMAKIKFYFRSREQVVVRRGQLRRIGRMIMNLEAQVFQFLLGSKCPVSRGIFVHEQG